MLLFNWGRGGWRLGGGLSGATSASLSQTLNYNLKTVRFAFWATGVCSSGALRTLLTSFSISARDLIVMPIKLSCGIWNHKHEEEGGGQRRKGGNTYTRNMAVRLRAKQTCLKSLILSLSWRRYKHGDGDDPQPAKRLVLHWASAWLTAQTHQSAGKMAREKVTNGWLFWIRDKRWDQSGTANPQQAAGEGTGTRYGLILLRPLENLNIWIVFPLKLIQFTVCNCGLTINNVN